MQRKHEAPFTALCTQFPQTAGHGTDLRGPRGVAYKGLCSVLVPVENKVLDLFG